MDQQAPPVQPLQSLKSGPEDREENKGMAMIAYLGVLCFFPLFLKKDSEFAQYHGKQGLILLIVWVVINLLYFIPLLGWFLIPFGQLFCVVMMVVGALNAWHGEMKELPWIGQFANKLGL